MTPDSGRGHDGRRPAPARPRRLASALAALAVLAVAGGGAEAQLPIRADSDTGPPGQLCPPSCQHAVRQPVCGTDSVTYPSQCHLAMAGCRGAGLKFRHWGPCESNPGGSVCQQRRAAALRGRPGVSQPQNIYVPQCTEDGLFDEIQCHRGTGYCWCVDDQGGAVVGTAVLNSRPECSARKVRDSARETSSKKPRVKGRRRGRCGSRAKTIFRDNVMRMIQEEYERYRRVHADPDDGAAPVHNLERMAADWKFAQLDRDQSGNVSRREIRRLRRKARRQLKPSSCARRFHRYCDTDSSRSLSRQEWLLCVGVSREDISLRAFLALDEEQQGAADEGDAGQSDADARLAPVSARTRMFDMLLGEESITEKSAEELENNCEADRRQALDNQRLAEMEGKMTNSFFIPSCTPDHKYSPVQCHNSTGYCWCADPDTGQVVAQNTVRNRVPDCSNLRTDTKGRRRSQRGRRRLPKACRGAERLQSFLRRLMDHLTSRMIRALEQRKYILPDSDQEKTFEEKVAKWKFSASDNNKNNVLDRREWKALRQEFSQDPQLRRCGRRLPRYCDANNDREIDLHEWLICLGAIKEKPNPFEEYLISDD